MTPALQKLHERKATLATEVRSLSDAAAPTEEQAATVDAKATELRSVLDQIERTEKVEEVLAQAETRSTASVTNAGLVVAPKRTVTATALKPLPIMGEQRGFEIETAEAVGKSLVDLAHGRIREIRAVTASTHPIGVNDTLEPDSMGEKSTLYDGRGSELVAHEMYRGILNVINYESVAAKLATWLQVGTNGMYVPLGEDIQEADWYEENCEILPIKPNTKRATLDLKKMGARAQVSNELMEDAYVSVAQVVTRTIGNAFAKKLDKTLIQGDAKIGFAGIVPSIPSGQTVTTAAAGKVTIDEIASVIGKVDPMAGNRVWLVSDEGWTKVMGLAAGAIGVNVTQGVTQTIFGSPVIKTSLLPAKTYAVYGDFSMAAAIGYKRGLTIRSSWERAIEYDQTVFVGTARYAFAVMASKYLAALKSA